jgi:hypothetical protein
MKKCWVAVGADSAGSAGSGGGLQFYFVSSPINNYQSK